MSRQKPVKDIILIKKASGEKEPFDKEKLKRSLLNAGAENKLITEIISDIEEWIYDGITTKKIYSRAFTILRKRKTIAALKYRIKQAMLELGPTGYPFEYFIGEVFKKQGYQIDVGVITEGKCITHEVDVIATNKKTQHLIECKYSKDQGKQINIQVPLYVSSRVNDIIYKRKKSPEYKGFYFYGWVVSNTRFSLDSIQYGKCSGLKLLGWDYPKGKSLTDIIEKEKIYPITILSRLTKKEKQELLDSNIVVCSQILKKPEVLDNLRLNKKKHRLLFQELEDICG